MFFVVGDGRDLFGGEGVKPLFIEVGLGRDEDVVVVGEFEHLAWSLFGLVIEVFGPFEWIGGINLDGGGAGFFTGEGGLRVEEVAIRLADVFGEETTGDVFVGRGAGGEKVDARSAEVGCPGDSLSPGAGGKVEGEGGKEILEGGVEVFGMTLPNVHQVKIVVGEDRCKIGADRKDIAMADEDGFDFGEFGDGFGHDLEKL